MSGKAEGIMEDAKLAGSFVKSAGSNVILSICIIVLTISLIVSVVTAKVGADRYTGADHKEFVAEVHAERNELWERQHEINQELFDRVEALGDNSYEIRKDVAVTKEKVTGIERDIAEIKNILLRGNE